MNSFAILRQLIGIIIVIVVLVVVIRVQQGFALSQLVDHPSLLWRNMFSARGY